MKGTGLLRPRKLLMCGWMFNMCVGILSGIAKRCAQADCGDITLGGTGGNFARAAGLAVDSCWW